MARYKDSPSLPPCGGRRRHCFKRKDGLGANLSVGTSGQTLKKRRRKRTRAARRGSLGNGKRSWGPFLASPGNFSGPKSYVMCAMFALKTQILLALKAEQ